MSKVINKKLHPYYKTGIYGWLGENDYIICPICGEVLGMKYWGYQAENSGDNKCPECGQELDYSEIYEFEDTLYFRQLLEIQDAKIENLEHRLANCIEPKFKKDSYVYAFFTTNEIYKGQIDAFDYYTNSYLIFPNEDIGNEWIPAHLVFKTKKEAEAKLKEMKSEN